MKRIMQYKWSLLILVVQLVLAFWLGSQLPGDARVPSHWDIRGEVNGTMDVNTSIWMPIGVNAMILLLFFAFPWISPRYREQEERLERVIPGFAIILNGGFALVQLVSMRMAISGVSGSHWMLVVVGCMIAAVGNLMPKIPQNYFIGVKLPWTLSDEENWRLTHRLGGRTFTFGGLILSLSALSMPVGLRVGLGIVAIASFLVPVLYSYLLYYRKNHS
jgi:uncharacterized membrane protein